MTLPSDAHVTFTKDGMEINIEVCVNYNYRISLYDTCDADSEHWCSYCGDAYNGASTEINRQELKTLIDKLTEVYNLPEIPHPMKGD